MTHGSFQKRVVIALMLLAALVVSAANAPGSQAASQARVADAAVGRPVTVAGTRLTAATAAQASAQAAAVGRPVEVMRDRTDWTQVFAEPGGGFRTVESLVPVRARRPDGSWVPVDTTLSVRPDGLVAPGAITTGLSLSDGGTGRLFTLSQGGHSLSMSWPFGALPVPSLSGPTATYPNVLPGVNLLVSATPTGVSDLVEVTSPAAAANPALARLTFPVSGSGLSVRADRQGNLTALDVSGHPVFDAAAPRMWDSAGMRAPGGRVPRANGAPDGPAPGDHEAMLGVSVGAGSVSLRPAASVLSGSAVKYPVFIDPTWNGHESDATWLDVWQNSAGTSGDWEPASSTSGGIRSGVCPDGSCPNGLLTVFRSYINFTLPPGYAGSAPDYVDAQLQITEQWSWSCNPSTLELWQTSHADKGIDWNSRPQQLTELAWPSMAHGWSSSGPGGPSNCPAATVAMDATPALKAAGKPGYGSSTVTFELRASDTAESSLDQNSWKRFDANTMDLVLYWRHKPDVPTDVRTQGVFDATTGQTVTGCSGSRSAPDWVNTNAPVWQATVDDSADRHYDQDNGAANEPLDGEFSWQNLTTGTSGGLGADQNSDSKGNNIGAPPGTQFTGKRSGTPGNEYSWQAYGASLPNVPTGIAGDKAPVLSGPSSSPACYFQPDQSAPSSAPSVSGPSSLPVGTQGTYTFTAGAQDTPVGGGSGTVNDVVGFYWGIDNPQPSAYVPASTIGGTASTATVTFIPFSTAEADIYVRAVDRAGNVGPDSPLYPVTATTAQGNIAELAWWRLNNNGLNSAAAAGEADADLTLSSSASFGCPGQATAGPAGYTCSLALDGLSSRAFTGRPVMGNDGSFSVSAWADPAGCGSTSYCAVLSQGASTVSAFTLGYQQSGTANGTSVSCPCWIFAMPKQDASGGEYSPAGSSLGWNVAAWHIPSSALNTWTQLTGVFNASHNQLLLYVNGGDGLQRPGDGLAGDGNPAAAATANPWTTGPGNGVFRIGADWTTAAGPADYFHGAVSDGCVFYGVLLASPQQPDVQRLYDQGPGYGQDSGDGCAALYSSYP